MHDKENTNVECFELFYCMNKIKDGYINHL